MSGARILAIDDDQVLGLSISHILQDHDVAIAESGEQALEVFQAQPFDLVICDLMLPGMDGMEVIRRIRDIRPSAKVMVASAHGTPENLLAGLRNHVVDFVLKPFAPTDLQCAVENVLHGESAIEVISATPKWIELQIPASFQVAASLTGFFKELQADLDEEIRTNIGTTFRELINNAIEHGAKGDHRKKIRVSFVRMQKALIYRIDDPGPGFDLSKLGHAAISYPTDPMAHLEVRQAQGLRAGGYGMMWTESLADEVVYDQHRNKVMFIKYVTHE